MKEGLSKPEVKLDVLKGKKFFVILTPYTIEFIDFNETLFYHLILIHVPYPTWKACFKFYY